MSLPAITQSRPMPLSIEEKTLEGGVKVYDHTGGRVVVSYDKELSSKVAKAVYHIIVDGKELQDAPYSCGCGKEHLFALGNSKTITLSFLEEGRFVHIKETDPHAEFNGYIDLTQLRDAAIGYVYPYMPIDIGKEFSERKLAIFTQENPEYKPLITGHNRHGVVSVSYEIQRVNAAATLRFLLYWASPQDEKMKLIGSLPLGSICISKLYAGQKVITKEPGMQFDIRLKKLQTNTDASLNLNDEPCVLLEANALFGR